jgi:lysine 2,3-aminomutase
MNKCVILRGENDNTQTLQRLMMICYEHKILPYDLYDCDPVKGGMHFRVPPEEVWRLYQSLSSLPGPAQPHLVVVDRNVKKHKVIYSPFVERDALLSFLKTRELTTTQE